MCVDIDHCGDISWNRSQVGLMVGTSRTSEAIDSRPCAADLAIDF